MATHQPSSEQPNLPTPEYPDELAKKTFIITMVGVVAFVGVAFVFVIL